MHFLRADFDYFLNLIFNNELCELYVCGMNTYALLHYSCSQ